MNLSHWIVRRAEHKPNAVAIRFEAHDIDYSGYALRIGRCAAMLHRELGIRRGDRVAYLGTNSPEMLDLVMALAKLGAILVPLNWRLAPPEHLYMLRHAEAKALLVEPEFRDHVEGFRAELAGCACVGYGFDGPGWLNHGLLFSAGAPCVADAGGPDNAILIVYTSGTTGRPKGAVLTQEALLFNAINSVAYHEMTGEDRILTTLPMFHVGGLNIQTLPAFHAGATVILHRRFHPAETLAAVAADQPTLLVLVPAAMKAMIEHPDWAATDLSSLRMITAGSQIIPEGLISAFHDRDVPVGQVYGSTETAPIAIALDRHDARRKLGSTGTPALHCEARIVDDAGRDVPRGTSGEILVRGRNVMREYWRDPEGTAAAFLDGWYRSGDVGHQDEDGYFVIDERKRDVVISGGENIYPAELEAVLTEHPGIADAAVVARPDPKWGEVPVAFVVARPGADLDAAAVLRLFEGRLARFKHPRAVVLVDALPRNVMGKVLRYKLREAQ